MKQTKRTQSSRWATVVTVILVGSAGLISCASRPNESLSNSAPPTSDAAPQAGAAETQELGDQRSQNLAATQSKAAEGAPATRQPPQLIKTASLTLRVAAVEKSLDSVSDILGKQQGDLLKLDDQPPRKDGDRHIYALQLRVPQSNLSPTLNDLEALGTVKKRSIQAQDVSDQLIDSQARLKNLRKSEEMVLKIMDRSGSIPDVLSASKELSTIRENIERIDAQLQNLKTRVAFSTINLRLEAETTSIEPKTGVGIQLQDAWKRSTSAMGTLTMAFLKLGIWGIAFSPYLIALGLLIWLGSLYKSKSWPKSDSNGPQSET